LTVLSPDKIKYLSLLSKSYPSVQAASTEIINLNAILQLPKGTEHFISDIHGEHRFFIHILRNASGSVRKKIEEIFKDELSTEEKSLLAVLIYYPEEKLADLKSQGIVNTQWYKDTLYRLTLVCRKATSKYTRSKVRKALPKDFEYIIDELINTNIKDENKKVYFDGIIQTIIDINRADAFITAMANLIHRMIIDKLHIIGDIFDRGPSAPDIIDSLMHHHNVDIQWGNHDILWMGASLGQPCCIANVMRNCIRYSHFDTLEDAYGINVRPLALFAIEQYRDDPCLSAMPKNLEHAVDSRLMEDANLAAKMHKAIAIIQFKLEGQTILEHPEYKMEHRLFLDTLDTENGTVTIEGKTYQLNDRNFPTIDPADPYALTPEEAQLMYKLQLSFCHSQRLKEHISFLFSKGSIYKSFNGNLMYHGCIPLNPDGSFAQVQFDGRTMCGKEYLDYCDHLCRHAAIGAPDDKERKNGMDFLWYLWCGPKSPLNGKDKMTTFERLFIDDKATWTENRDPYYSFIDDVGVICSILEDFSLSPKYGHIINGHVPVKIKKGESPVHADGKIIFIDGGISKAYQSVTGIGGYTLVSNSVKLFLSQHYPFEASEAIDHNSDMHSILIPIHKYEKRIRIRDTDDGADILEKISELQELLDAYLSGDIPQKG